MESNIDTSSESGADTTVTRVDSRHSPRGPGGQKYLASGRTMSMRLWENQPVAHDQTTSMSREYETVGFVISGRAELELEGQTVTLEPGNSWVVPAGSSHRYRILESSTAVEATHPPSHLHDREQPPE